MELSQANQRDLQVLMNCPGYLYCKQRSCPVYDIYKNKCGYENFLSTFSTKLYETFEKDKFENTR